MTVKDLWAGRSKSEIADLRARNAPRWQRRWREGAGRDAPQRKQSYKEPQKAQAYLDDANQMQSPQARRPAGSPADPLPSAPFLVAISPPRPTGLHGPSSPTVGMLATCAMPSATGSSPRSTPPR